MNYWIFQSYKFERPSKLPYTIPWRASRYREDMKSGDLVYLWLSGEERGVHAWGHLTSEPRDTGDGTWVVKYQLETWLENPVKVPPAIEPPPSLKGLLILRMAVGTNFLISREEAQAIAALIGPETERPKVE